MIMFLVEVVVVALKLTWGLIKIAATIVGVIFVGALLFGAGLYALAFIGLIVAGIAGIVVAFGA